MDKKYVKNFLSKQVSKHNGKRFIRYRCLNSFQQENFFNKHIEYCQSKDFIFTEVPEKETFIYLTIMKDL